MDGRALDNLVERFNKLLTLVAVVFLAVTVGIVIANAACRYLLHVSWTASAELARYSMIWSALLGAAVLVNRHEHLSVELLEQALRGRLRTAVRVLVAAGSMVFYLVVVVSGSMLVARTSGQVASSVEWLPMSAVYVAVPVSGLFMLLGSGVVLARAQGDEVDR